MDWGQDMDEERQQYCTFTLGDHWFGIDARAVQEVRRAGEAADTHGIECLGAARKLCLQLRVDAD